MEIRIDESIHNHWIFQDAEKFKWWVDLHFMADEEGKIYMSLSDLSHRWKAERTKVSRFLSKLSAAPIGATLVQHQVQQITLTRIESYKDERNRECNTCATPQRTPPCSPSSFSPTPPISSPPIIPQENPSSPAHTREDEFVRKYREEGMWLDVAMILHVTDLDMCKRMFEEFVVEYRHKGDTHSCYTDFKKHFIQWARIAVNKMPKQQDKPQGKAIPRTSISDIFK